MLCRRLITFKPMQPGVTGYARLQWQSGYVDVQIQLRGLTCCGTRFFAYTGEGEARDLGRGRVNGQGEAGLTVRLPETALPSGKLLALLALTDEARPKPLMIGPNGKQDAGDALDVRNAALALCDRLGRPAAAPAPRTEKATAASEAPAVPPKPSLPEAHRKAPVFQRKTDQLPREIFLPAIDPSPYMAAQEKEAEGACQQPASPGVRPGEKSRPAKKSIQGLRPLEWPPALAGVKRYFDGATPCAPFDLPGWRFVRASDTGGPPGLWVGYLARDGRVARVAYAHQGNTAAAPGFLPIRGRDGTVYQLLGVPREML